MMSKIKLLITMFIKTGIEKIVHFLQKLNYTLSHHHPVKFLERNIPEILCSQIVPLFILIS